MDHAWASARFSSQLACPCGQCFGWPDDLTTLEDTARWLEEVERALGSHYRLTVVSGYRCPSWDAEVAEAGPVGDLHTRGLAVDVCVQDMSPGQLQRHLAPLTDLVPGLLSHRGLSHLHRAPGPPVRWRP